MLEEYTISMSLSSLSTALTSQSTIHVVVEELQNGRGGLSEECRKQIAAMTESDVKKLKEEFTELQSAVASISVKSVGVIGVLNIAQVQTSTSGQTLQTPEDLRNPLLQEFSHIK